MNIVIIGGSYGIGYSYYKKVKDKGDNIKILSRTQGEINGDDWIKFDIMKSLEEDQPFPETFDKIDSLIYLPGSIKLGLFSSFKKDDILDDYKLNVLGAFEAVKAYRKELKKSDSASINFISSIVAQTGMSLHSVVGMSKGALEGLVRNLAAELAPKVRVNALALSLVDTPLAKNITKNEKVLEKTIEKHPLKRIGNPDEVSDMLQVLTHFSPWLTGQVITYDGGITSLR